MSDLASPNLSNALSLAVSCRHLDEPPGGPYQAEHGGPSSAGEANPGHPFGEDLGARPQCGDHDQHDRCLGDVDAEVERRERGDALGCGDAEAVEVRRETQSVDDADKPGEPGAGVGGSTS